MSAPMRRTRSACCPCAASGHAVAVPPRSMMNWRRLMPGLSIWQRAATMAQTGPSPIGRTGDPVIGSPIGERPHHLVKGGFRLKADAGEVGQADERILHRAGVGEAAERGEYVGVAFVAAEAEPDRDVEGELVAAMRHAAPRRPAVPSEHV